MSSLFYRKLRTTDLDEMCELFRTHLNSEPDRVRIETNLDVNPAFVCLHNHTVIAFTYTFEFAPDVLELANVFVHPNYRNQQVGEQLVTMVETAAAKQHYAAVLLANSLLYRTTEKKRSAATFYERLGYVNVLSTGPTNIYTKHLH